MSNFNVESWLKENTKTWLVTGVAGFIGSNLLEYLLKNNQRVVGLDNFSTGYRRNLEEVEMLVTDAQWQNFIFHEGDICNIGDCRIALQAFTKSENTYQVDYVLHQAALGSVPRSIKDPIQTNLVNIGGFLNVLVAAKEANVKKFIYAASSSTYGDHPALPKKEDVIGRPLSPYAVTKYVNELYAEVFKKTYGLNSVGLRYFNVFGPRQDPQGSYAAVIPKWIDALIYNKDIAINGDGETSRDFCYIENVILANVLAAVIDKNQESDGGELVSEIYNVALGDKTTLNELYNIIFNLLDEFGIKSVSTVKYLEFRVGDVRHSQADISKAMTHINYSPKYKIKNGLKKTVKWYIDKK